MSVYRTAVRFGLLLGAVEIGYDFFFRFAGLHFTSNWSWVYYLMLPVFIWWAQVSRRGATGSLRFTDAMVVGFGTSSFGSVVYCVYIWIHNRFIDDSLLVSVRDYQLMRFVEMDWTEAQVAAGTAQMDVFLQPSLFALVVCGRMILYGVAFSFVISLWNRTTDSTE